MPSAFLHARISAIRRNEQLRLKLATAGTALALALQWPAAPALDIDYDAYGLSSVLFTPVS